MLSTSRDSGNATRGPPQAAIVTRSLPDLRRNETLRAPQRRASVGKWAGIARKLARFWSQLSAASRRIVNSPPWN